MIDSIPHILRHWYGTKGLSADEYCLLSVKQSPDRSCIAIRTAVDDGEGTEWLLIDTSGKARPAHHQSVGTWVDLKPPPQGLPDDVESEIEYAVRVLGVSARYSVKDNETGQWVA